VKLRREVCSWREQGRARRRATFELSEREQGGGQRGDVEFRERNLSLPRNKYRRFGSGATGARENDSVYERLHGIYCVEERGRGYSVFPDVRVEGEAQMKQRRSSAPSRERIRSDLDWIGW
jgi:hypothetical protein